MNKSIYIGSTIVFIILLIVIGLNIKKSSENNDSSLLTSTDNSLLETTWEQLSDSEKDEIIGSWEDGTIEEIVIKKGDRFIIEESYYDQTVYLVTFESKNRAILGDVQILIDKDTGEIIGYLGRD